MKTEHEKEQEEAHRRDFEKHWRTVLVPAFLELGYSVAKILTVKENAFESWLADDDLYRKLNS